MNKPVEDIKDNKSNNIENENISFEYNEIIKQIFSHPILRKKYNFKIKSKQL